VQKLFRKVLNPVPSYPLPLFDGKRVVGRLKLNEWPLPDRARVNVGFQVERRRIERQRRLQPAEIGRLIFTPKLLPEFTCAKKVLLAERNPHEPAEEFIATDDWDFQPTANKEMLLVNHAQIISQLASRLTFIFRQHVPKCRSARPVDCREAVVFFAASSANVTVHRQRESFLSESLMRSEKFALGDSLSVTVTAFSAAAF
jgi:hypothetical protein